MTKDLHYCVGESLDNDELKLVALVFEYENRKLLLREQLLDLENKKTECDLLTRVIDWLHNIAKKTAYFDQFGIDYEKFYQAFAQFMDMGSATVLNEWIQVHCPILYELRDSFKPLMQELADLRENLIYEMKQIMDTYHDNYKQLCQIQVGIVNKYNLEQHDDLDTSEFESC